MGKLFLRDALESISHGLHQIGRQRHQPTDRRRQIDTAERPGVIAMAGFFLLHDADNGAAARVVGGQPPQVLAKMGFDLAFGFDDETETDRVTE